MVLYRATNTKDGRCYIGVTGQPFKTRLNEHRYCSRVSSRLPLHAAIQRDGWDAFQWDVLAHVDDRELLLLAEKEAVDKFGSHVSRGGYNATVGGSGVAGFTFSDESRAKIAAANIGRVKSAETRAKLSAAHKGRMPSAATLEAAWSAPWTPGRVEKLRASKRAIGTMDKFNPEQLEQMRKMRLAGSTYKELAAHFGCARSHAFKLTRGLRKRGGAA
jgi:group I intron endonuclease